METQPKAKHPVFNGEYEILSSLGEGNTSKVYLCRSMTDKKKYVALKLLREEFLSRDASSIKSVEQEIQILQGLNHSNIVNILGYGSEGHVVKPSGREIKNLVYIILEYVTGGLLFDVCQTMGGMGEDGGRFFLSQMIDVLEYLQSKNVVHRDLKLENILVDDNLHMKVADFGFATFKKIHKLQSYRGTMTYMAPEIKEGKTYDGRQIDIFSTGVILFIIVQGIFPFKEAKKDEYFYNLILTGQIDQYWKKVGGESLSPEFKDLILKIFSYDGSQRPTLQQLKEHPWMQKPFSMKLARQGLLDKLQEIRSQKTSASSRDDKGSSRGGEMDCYIRAPLDAECSKHLELYRFNDMMDHDIQTSPDTVWEELNQFNVEMYDSKLTLEANAEKRCFYIEEKDESGASLFLVKVKFYEQDPEVCDGEEGRLRLRFTKKRGDLLSWHALLKKMNETFFSDILLAPVKHHQEELKAEEVEVA